MITSYVAHVLCGYSSGLFKIFRIIFRELTFYNTHMNKMNLNGMYIFIILFSLSHTDKIAKCSTESNGAMSKVCTPKYS